MTDSSLAISDRVVIRCPACGFSEHADPDTLIGAPMIVCRKCGETWPTARVRRRRVMASGAVAEEPPTELESERRPLVTYSDGADKAWAAKIAADLPPETRRPSRIPGTAAAMAAVLFIGVFLGGREAAVATLPDLAGLYAALGMPVNLDGLVIEELEAERGRTGDASRLTVRGLIRNVTRTEQAVPPMTASLAGGAGAPGSLRAYEVPANRIAAGEAAAFLLEFGGVPREAAAIAVRFRRPGERLPAGSGGDPAAP